MLHYSAADIIGWDQLSPWLLLPSTEHILIKTLLYTYHSGEKLQGRGREGQREREGQKSREGERVHWWGTMLLLGRWPAHRKNNWRSLSSTAQVLPYSFFLWPVVFLIGIHCLSLLLPQAFKRIGTQINQLFFFYLINLGKVL